jgi:GT2 family glycosyltransferase
VKTAVVILNYNGKHFLEKFLDSVVRYSSLPDVAIYVADNASTDDSVAYLQQNYPGIHLIQLSQNLGFAEGYNQALKQIEAEYYVLLNSDVEVSPRWIEPIIGYMDAHPQAAACQPKIKAFQNKDRFEHAGAAGGFIDKYGFPFCRGRVMGTTEIDKGQYDTIAEVFWATGACLFIRSNDYWSVGGLDGDFFAHMEEIDLCWRLKSRGKQIFCIPQSTIYHVGGGTLTVENPKKTYLNFRNNLLMLYKNLPEKEVNKVIFTRMLIDSIAVFQYIIFGKIANARSVWNAHQDFKKMKPAFDVKRKENLALQTEKNLTGKLNKSIVFLFYIKRNKKYSDIQWK